MFGRTSARPDGPVRARGRVLADSWHPVQPPSRGASRWLTGREKTSMLWEWELWAVSAYRVPGNGSVSSPGVSLCSCAGRWPAGPLSIPKSFGRSSCVTSVTGASLSCCRVGFLLLSPSAVALLSLGTCLFKGRGALGGEGATAGGSSLPVCPCSPPPAPALAKPLPGHGGRKEKRPGHGQRGPSGVPQAACGEAAAVSTQTSD